MQIQLESVAVRGQLYAKGGELATQVPPASDATHATHATPASQLVANPRGSQGGEGWGGGGGGGGGGLGRYALPLEEKARGCQVISEWFMASSSKGRLGSLALTSPSFLHRPCSRGDDEQEGKAGYASELEGLVNLIMRGVQLQTNTTTAGKGSSSSTAAAASNDGGDAAKGGEAGMARACTDETGMYPFTNRLRRQQHASGARQKHASGARQGGGALHAQELKVHGRQRSATQRSRDLVVLVRIWGGPWELDDCSLSCSGAEMGQGDVGGGCVVVCSKESTCVIRRCSISPQVFPLFHSPNPEPSTVEQRTPKPETPLSSVGVESSVREQEVLDLTAALNPQIQAPNLKPQTPNPKPQSPSPDA
jgi:hypothetical protein